MRGIRRFSQAISEGDGISLLAEVADSDDARSAETDGAEGIVVHAGIAGVREATELPILWYRGGPLVDARDAGADAYLVAVEGLEAEDGQLEALQEEAAELGLDLVVAVRDEDELRLALDRLDPDIFLLSGRRGDAEGLEYVLRLLPDVPAGKLAIAEVDLSARDEVAELERAGVDAVIVPGAAVGRFVGAPPPEV